MSTISSVTSHSQNVADTLAPSNHSFSSNAQGCSSGLASFSTSISSMGMHLGKQFDEAMSKLDRRNIQKYLNAQTDDKALQFLYRLTPNLLANIRASIFDKAHLEPSFFGDASDLYIKANPRSELTRQVVAGQIGEIAPVRVDAKIDETPVQTKGCCALFFSRISSLVIGFVNWFASFFVSAKEMKEELDQIENSSLCDLIDLKTMIESPYHTNDFISRCIHVLFSQYPALKEQMCYYVYEEAKKEISDISNPNFGLDMINENPRGRFLLSAVDRMIQAESEVIKVRLMDK